MKAKHFQNQSVLLGKPEGSCFSCNLQDMKYDIALKGCS